MIRVAVPAFLLLAACATTGATPGQSGVQDRAMARVERTLAGLTPGAPQRCLRREDANEIRTAEGVIVYVAGRNRVWRNNVVGSGCTGLSRGDIVVTEGIAGRYCNGDIVRTRTPNGGFSGSCSLGEFVPYTRQ